MKRAVAAFERHDPDRESLPLVLDSPHSGEHYPDDFDHAPPREHVRRAEDTHVGRLYRSATAHGATVIEANFPRSYIDANRSLADIDPSLMDGDWDEPVRPSRKTELGIGLIWRLARGGVPMYDRKLSVGEVRQRIQRWYVPYHSAVDAALDERYSAFGAVWHINCHSMPAMGDVWSDDAGRPRADFVLGDRDGTTCAREFTDAIAACLRRMGYAVAINDPYKGVELVRKHGRPAEKRHSLQIEIKRTLYMDEQTLLPNAGYDQLKANIDRLIGEVREHIRAEMANGAGAVELSR